MKKRKTRKENIFFLVVVTTIAVFSWTGFNIYNTFNKSTIPQVLQQQLKPLKPVFNEKVLESLKNRRTISQKQLDSIPEITKFGLPEKEENKEASPEGTINNEE